MDQAIVDNRDNLLRPEALKSWEDMNSTEQTHAATMLLDTLRRAPSSSPTTSSSPPWSGCPREHQREEELRCHGVRLLPDLRLESALDAPTRIRCELYPAGGFENTLTRVKPHEEVLDVYVLSTDGQVQDFRFPQTSKEGASIQLSSNTVKVNSKNGVAKWVFVTLHRHLGRFLKARENAPLRGASEPARRNLSLTVNSHILSASITKESSRVYVTDPVVFTLEHLDKEHYHNPNCSFWNYSERSMMGYWSTQGCKLLDTNKSHTTCSCSHLTNFAILMAHRGNVVSTSSLPLPHSSHGISTPPPSPLYST
ncbi:unnamed protein product [Arctogadus glacialis]